MPGEKASQHSLGWLGTGRMGLPMAKRLMDAGHNLSVYNRSREKAEPLEKLGATIVSSPSELASNEVVFTILSTGDVLREQLLGPSGLMANPQVRTKIVVDCTTISEEDSRSIREALAERGVAFIAAPVSGNGKVVAAGQLSVVASGPEDIYREVEPYLSLLGKGASYVGEGDLSRIVKSCHNVLLGVVTQCLAEITVVAEKAGVPRHAFLDFINMSVMGSIFTRYKTPAFVHLDFTTTFTPYLLRKDLDIGIGEANKHDVPMPVATVTRNLVQTLMNHGYRDTDFSTLLELQAKASGLELEPEDIDVSDGLNHTYSLKKK